MLTVLCCVRQAVAADHSFVVSLDNSTWFVGGPMEVMETGRLLSTADGTLHAKGPGTGGTSRDATGSFEWYAVNFTSASAPQLNWGVRFALYEDGSSVSFRQTFHSGIANFSGRSSADMPTAREWGTPGSGFPTFDASGRARLGGANGLGFVSYGEIGRTRTGRFPAGYKSGANEEDGVPLALLDEASGVAVVLSPSEGFYDNVFAVVDGGRGALASPHLRCGLIGTAVAVPAGLALETVLHVGAPETRRGMTAGMMGWGRFLLRRHGKQRAPADRNVQIRSLGYSTVGHYFYGLAAGHDAAATLGKVHDAAVSQPCGLRFSYYLVDSFWYREGSVPAPGGGSVPGYGGTWRWDDAIARDPAMFPRGLKALVASLGGSPLVMHMGEWVGSASPAGAPPYAANASWDWIVEAGASLPRPGSAGAALFWDWLFGRMAANGLAVYKLDHSQQQMPAMRHLLTTPGATAAWMTDMATAAGRHGVNKQYGGHISSGFLHSVTLPNANQARVSDDYIPGLKRPANACTAGADAHTVSPQGNVLLGRDTLYPWAVGLRPYKDAFFSGRQHWSSTTCFLSAKGPESTGYTKPEWWGLQELYPELNVVVSALTAGPVAPGDGIGDTDCALVARTCRRDMVLLKPDHPHHVLDDWWLGVVFGPSQGGSARPLPRGEVTQTSTCVPLRVDGDLVARAPPSKLCWGFVLGAAMQAGYTVTDANLDDGVAAGAGVSWSRRAGSPFPPTASTAFHRHGPQRPLAMQLPRQAGDDWGNYTLWKVAPTTCSGAGWTLLGEMDKIVSVSAQRIVSIDAGCGDRPDVTVWLVGAPGELVQLSFLRPGSEVVMLANTTMAVNGTGHVYLR